MQLVRRAVARVSTTSGRLWIRSDGTTKRVVGSVAGRRRFRSGRPMQSLAISVLLRPPFRQRHSLVGGPVAKVQDGTGARCAAKTRSAAGSRCPPASPSQVTPLAVAHQHAGSFSAGLFPSRGMCDVGVIGTLSMGLEMAAQLAAARRPGRPGGPPRNAPASSPASPPPMLPGRPSWSTCVALLVARNRGYSWGISPALRVAVLPKSLVESRCGGEVPSRNEEFVGSIRGVSRGDCSQCPSYVRRLPTPRRT